MAKQCSSCGTVLDADDSIFPDPPDGACWYCYQPLRDDGIWHLGGYVHSRCFDEYLRKEASASVAGACLNPS